MKSFTATVFTVLFALPLLYRMDGAAGDTTSCAGSPFCGLIEGDCLIAESKIVPATVYHSSSTAAVCSGRCGLFVSGPKCSFTGTQMNSALIALGKANCEVCGIFTDNNNCHFKVDYYTGC